MSYIYNTVILEIQHVIIYLLYCTFEILEYGQIKFLLNLNFISSFYKLYMVEKVTHNKH